MYTIDTYDLIAEAERKIMDEYLKLESIHPIDIVNNTSEVLTEASISSFQIKKTLDKIVAAIQAAIKKFKDISRQLKSKNSEWLAQAKSFDLSKADLSNFREEIFPYWNSIPSKFNISIPKFDMRHVLLYEDDGTKFMQKYFPTIIDDKGNINKNILRGLSETSNKRKVPVEYGRVKAVYGDLLRIIETIYKLRDKVARDMVEIANTVKRVRNMGAPLNESVLLERSMFKDEYFDLLLEAFTTPDDIEKEMDAKEGKNDKTGVKVDSEDNAKASMMDRQLKAVVAWSKMCSAVTTAEMDILDEAYSECVKFISKVMKK